MDKKYILLDLDGTLTDPKEGITKCVQYALAAAGIDEPNLDNLEGYIGPPLDVSFRTFHGMNVEDSWKAVDKYRERFRERGVIENELIDGIIPCLEALNKAGKMLILATCKPEIFMYQIIEHFGIDKYLAFAVGSELDGTRKHKHEVIEEVFVRLKARLGTDEDINSLKADAIMVGDRDQDINGAHEAMIESVGVKFGYAKEGELEEAGADYIVNTVQELRELLLGGESNMKKTLIVVDMQKDFVDGSLGTKEAVDIVENVKQKIKEYRDRGDEVIFTRDTHQENYLETNEGKNLPVVHCIEGTEGWQIIKELEVGDSVCIDKPSFGWLGWKEMDLQCVELIGLCTDICVVSNALIIKAMFPEIEVVVDSKCCAGVTPESHEAALATMKMCQIKVI